MQERHLIVGCLIFSLCLVKKIIRSYSEQNDCKMSTYYSQGLFHKGGSNTTQNLYWVINPPLGAGRVYDPWVYETN